MAVDSFGPAADAARHLTTGSLIIHALLGALFLAEIIVAGLALLTVRRGGGLAPSDGEAFADSTGSGGAWSTLDLLTASALLGVAVTTVCGLVLARAGLFSTGAVAALLGGATVLICLSRGWPRFVLPRLRRLSAPEVLALLLAAGTVAYVTAFRFHEVAGLRDPGVYVNTGIELSRTGTLGWTDPAIERFGFYGAFHLLEDIGFKVDGNPRWLRFAGYYLPRPERGEVEPQFLHGYEVWMALAYGLGGVQGTQILNGVFAALALLAIFGAMRGVTGSQAAAGFTAVLLAASPAQLWFARMPGNEVMIQALLWGFLLFHARALHEWCDGSLQADWRSIAPRRLTAAALVLLGCATLVKIAAWLLLPAAAFDFGYQRARGRMRVSGWTLWGAFFLLALGAFLHARFGAPLYYYGSWKFTAGVRGISRFLFPVLFVGGTLAACSLGALTAPVLALLGRRVGQGRRPLGAAAVVTVALAGVWLWQVWKLKAGIPERQIWSEATNVAEFVFYLGPVLFLLGAFGLVWLAARRPAPAAAVFLLLLLGSSLLLVQRNLDANHPWAARRWVPFLFPAFLAGGGYFFSRVRGGGEAPVWRRGGAVAGVAGSAALLLNAAPQLVTTRNFYGAVPALDRLANHLYPTDVILTHPTGGLMRWAPYLKARFDVDWYKHPFRPEAWSDTLPVLRAAAAAGHRLIYVADSQLSTSSAVLRALRPIHTETVAFTELPDAVRRISPSAVQTSQTITLYEMNPAELVRGWWPGLQQELPSPPPRHPLPLDLGMGREAEPYIENVFDPTEVAPGVAFRWTNGKFRLYLGELLQLSLPEGRGPLRITARIANGRPEMKDPLLVSWYLDLSIKGRQRELARTPIGADWTDVTVEVDPALIRRDSWLELLSLRPPVGTQYPTGVLGHMIQSIRIE